jgi:hypothetical protein
LFSNCYSTADRVAIFIADGGKFALERGSRRRLQMSKFKMQPVRRSVGQPQARAAEARNCPVQGIADHQRFGCIRAHQHAAL